MNEARVGVAEKFTPAMAMVTTKRYQQVAYNPPGVTGSTRRSYGILVARLAITAVRGAICSQATSSNRSIARLYLRRRNYVR